MREAASTRPQRATTQRSRPPAGALPRGTAVGRYVVLRAVGAGAYGIVYAAYDPELDRTVAIKVLTAAGGGDTAGSQTRLMREARSIAKLSHPNVVAVHDVGEYDGSVFIAMEFVAGQDVWSWLSDDAVGPRPWREVLRVFRGAARGLAAAHDKGLVHRDFKPQNVLLGDDARVRVADFGLARVIDGADGQTDVGVTVGSPSSKTPSSTATGEAIGTPAYMAPEHRAGLPAGAAADQYSYCVALWEALGGAHPFAGSEGLVGMPGQEPKPGPRSRRVPRWLDAVVRRGLQYDADQRFGSMHDLLRALDRGRTRRRVTRLAALGAAGATGLVMWSLSGTRPCTGGAQQLGDAWDRSTRAAVRTAFVASTAAHASKSAETVEATLDRYARDWIALYTSACEATRVRGEQSEALLDRQLVCLAGRRRVLEGLANILAEPDATVVDNAARAAASLPPVDDCRTPPDASDLAPPPELAAQVEPVLDQIAEIAALDLAGKYEAAGTAAVATVAQAEAVGHAPTAAHALVRLGEAQSRLRDDAAPQTLRRAYLTALGSGADALAVHAAASLAYYAGVGKLDLAEGLRWADHAQALVKRSPVPPHVEAKLLGDIGTIHERKGDLDIARQMLTRSLDMRRQSLEPGHPDIALSLNNLALVLLKVGETDRARALLEEAHDDMLEAVGDEHPHVAAARGNLGRICATTGDLEAAKVYFEQALAGFVAAYGDEHPYSIASLENLANLQLDTGNPKPALARFEKALALSEKALPTDHPSRIEALDGLARARVATGDAAGAVDPLERALKIMTEAKGDAYRIVEMRTQLAQARFAAGDSDSAIQDACVAHRAAVTGGFADRSSEIGALLDEHGFAVDEHCAS